MNPFSAILPASQSNTSVSEAERERLKTKTPRKPPTGKVVQPDELPRFEQNDTIQNLKHIDTTCIKSLGEGFTSLNKNGRLIIFKLEIYLSNVLEVTHCIDVSTALRAKLYFQICSRSTTWMVQTKEKHVPYQHFHDS